MKERTLAIYHQGTLGPVCLSNPVCSQGQMMAGGQIFQEGRLILGGLWCLERGSLRHPVEADRQCLWTLLTGWTPVWTFSMCQGHMIFLSTRGTDFHLKIVRPHHQCWNSASQVWLTLFVIATTPLPITVGAPHFHSICYSLHLTCHFLVNFND